VKTRGKNRSHPRSAGLLLLLGSTALLLDLCGCASSHSVILERQRKYDDAEFAPYRRTGTATLTGQVSFKNRWGDVRFGVEDSVYLFPTTRYTTEWWQRTLLEGKYLPDPDPRSLTCMRTRVTDTKGRFTFTYLPAGEYFVVCTVRWDRYGEDSPTQVVNLGKKVRIGQGEDVDISLLEISSHRALIDPPITGANR
jgi:hypothetical protein